ncbi:MAG: DUF1028 domain-containing protein [Calditrichia bacterium]
MKLKMILSFFLLFFSMHSLTAQTFYKTPFANTYSIVAVDTVTGEIGCAVQSHWFSVGSIVLWAEAGVGAVCTQSFTNPSFGPRGLELMKAGATPEQAIEVLTGADESRDYRQLAMINSSGISAAYTGAKCIDAAGHISKPTYSVQANLMEKSSVWPAMEKAFVEATGSLAERMMTALEAAEAEGGDIRGRQSAAILVVKGESSGEVWNDRIVDLRVEDHPTPLKEMRRLLTVHKAYEHMNAGDHALETGDEAAALSEYGSAMDIMPKNLEMKYWTAVSLANINKVAEALPLFKTVFAGDKRWRELTPRLRKNGLLNVSDDVLKQIVMQ